MRDLAAHDASRRALVCALAAQCMVPRPSRAVDTVPSLMERLSARSLKPLSDSVPSMDGDLRYPQWLAGSWRATNTATGFSMPLGKRFVDPYLLRLGQQDATTGRQRQYLLSYEDGARPPPGQPTLTVRQQRPFSTIQEERAFTATKGTTIERGRYILDPPHPHGRIVLDVRDDVTPERSVIRGTDGPRELSRAASAWEVRKTVRSQLELDVAWAAWEECDDGTFVTSELAVQRSVLPLGVVDESYLEILFRFERPTGAEPQPDAVRASYRVAQYLSLPHATPPAAATKEARTLARQAAGRAVALLDYDVLLERRRPE